MAFVKFWAHAVWGTKYHRPVLSDAFRPELYAHIGQNAKKKKIYLDCINGYADHVHCLISMEPKQNIADIMQLLKGESSNWAGKQQIVKETWNGWADDYCAISVSPSMANRVRNYIRNQEAHHSKFTFRQEWERFVKECGFVVMNDGGVVAMAGGLKPAQSAPI